VKFEKVRITATSRLKPPVTLTSAEIEAHLAPVYDQLGLPEGRLELMTGIECRHFWEDDRLPSAAGIEAGKALLAESGVKPDSIDLLVHCGVCRDRLEPATAAYVHGGLGLSASCQIFDVSNACLGFVNAMLMAGGLIESGQIRHALLVSGENGKPLLDHTLRELLGGSFTRKTIKPYFANLTIGAGAAAMLLSAETESLSAGKPRLLGGVVRTDSAANVLCQGDRAEAGGLQMLTEAEALLDAGLNLAEHTWKDFRTEFSDQEIACTVCHQVGRTHQRKLLERLSLPLASDVATYPYMGNVGSVSLPFTLDVALREGRLLEGERAGLLGIGSGLSCAMLAVEK
jgi:3-oxoacyl-[acyl-carrier-protein] synthase III